MMTLCADLSWFAIVTDDVRYAERLRELGGAQEEEPVRANGLSGCERQGSADVRKLCDCREDDEFAAGPAGFEQTKAGAELNSTSVATETISDPGVVRELNRRL